MKLKWIKQSNNSSNDITQFISTIQWGGSASQAARKIDVTVVYSPIDEDIKDLKIKLGDRLKLYSDKNELLIDAMVYSRERKSEQGTITFSGYDDLNHLLKSNGSYNFKNITPEKITRKVCRQLEVKIGKVATTKVNIKKLLIDGDNHYDVIMKAYTKAHKSNGKKYMPLMVGRKLSVIEKGEVISNFVLNEKVNITSSSYSESIESMINKVKIYDDNGKQIGEVKNNSWMKTYGIFQDIYTKEDGINAKSAAERLLIGIEKSASIEALGNIECVSGFGIKIKDSLSGLTGKFWIDSDTHTLQNGNHTMSLDLAFKNIMDEQEAD